MATQEEKTRYHFDYEIGAWVEKYNPQKRKPTEKKEISEERFLKAYLKVASRGGCQLDIIKSYTPWMNKEELTKRIRHIRKNCLKNGYQLTAIPMRPIKKEKKEIVKNIDYGIIAEKFPKFLKSYGDTDDLDALMDPTDIRDNRAAYQEALAEHQRRLDSDEEYKRWHESMSKEESKRTFHENFLSKIK